MGQAVQRTTAGNEVHYERRRPEETTLYQVIQEQLETFLAQVDTESGASLPDFVEDEFDAFLERGILAHGFVRRCAVGTAATRSWGPSPVLAEFWLRHGSARVLERFTDEAAQQALCIAEPGGNRHRRRQGTEPGDGEPHDCLL